MNLFDQLGQVRRLPQKGIFFGVAAGLAEEFGWRRRNVRFILVLSALIASWPVILAYVIAVFALPAEDWAEEEREERAQRRRERHARQATQNRRRHHRRSRSQGQEGEVTDRANLYKGDLKTRFKKIDGRMRRLESYLHSNEHQLRQSFKDLEMG